MRKTLLIAATLLLLQLRFAIAAVTYHQVASNQLNALTTPFVIGINVTSSTNSVMFVGFCTANGVGNEVTQIIFESLPFTLIADISGAGNGSHAYLYRLINPPVANGTVSITLSTGRRSSGGAIVLHTVNQTTPADGEQTHINDPAINSTTTVSVVTELNDMILDVACKRSSSDALTMTTAANRTQRYNIASNHATPSNNIIAGGSTRTGTGSLTMPWSSPVNISMSMVGTNVNEAVAAPTNKLSLGFKLLK